MNRATILVAPDSFKGSLPAAQVAQSLIQGLSRVMPNSQYVSLAMADGGEGTGTVVEQLGGVRVSAPSVDIFGDFSQKYWIRWGRTALVEAAVGSGFVPQQTQSDHRGEHTTSYGTGLLIAAARADPSIDKVIVALGGTGSTDGGMGLLTALGARFEDADGHAVTHFGDNLARVTRFVAPRQGKPLVGLYDVQVPLVGARGAVRQFGVQKGIPLDALDRINRAMTHYGQCVQRGHGEDWLNKPGAGAAGGMGFGILAAGGDLEPGAETVARWCGLETHLQRADWVITGEGRMDTQTHEGKVVGTVVRYAARYHKPVIAVVGSRINDLTRLHQRGLTFVMPLVSGPMGLTEAMDTAPQLLSLVGEELGWLLNTWNY